MQQPASDQTTSPVSYEAWPLRMLRLILGLLWAMILALVGLAIWSNQSFLLELFPTDASRLILAAAGLCLSGAQFIFLMLVADDLCPQAPAGMTLFLKAFSGALFWMCLIFIAVTTWRSFG
jgi:hypothetical protein